MKEDVLVLPTILECEGYHRHDFVTGEPNSPHYGVAIYNNCLEALSLKDIILGVTIFNEFAIVNTKMLFKFCEGGWGSTKEHMDVLDIAPLFSPIANLSNVVLPKEFLEVLND